MVHPSIGRRFCFDFKQIMEANKCLSQGAISIDVLRR